MEMELSRVTTAKERTIDGMPIYLSLAPVLGLCLPAASQALHGPCTGMGFQEEGRLQMKGWNR